MWQSVYLCCLLLSSRSFMLSVRKIHVVYYGKIYGCFLFVFKDSNELLLRGQPLQETPLYSYKQYFRSSNSVMCVYVCQKRNIRQNMANLSHHIQSTILWFSIFQSPFSIFHIAIQAKPVSLRDSHLKK